ncbi:MAG: sulfatase-like hydrolase/transferase, partial [Planctomycetes bacterium]|nr:sulfatase-like hydrolase/transferase [Planctomycetota bacterium]
MGTTKNKTHLKTILVFLAIIIAGVLVWFVYARQSQIKHVILISIDTCRADYLSCYGFDRPTTPQIDDIASEGMLFRRAQTPVPMTLPAHCSMLTGLYPPTHRVRDNLEYRLDSSYQTLAGILDQQGFETGGIVSSIVLSEQFGTGEGFGSYQDGFEPPERSARDTSDLACEFLVENATKPFFLFLHYFDPHIPYAPPEPYARQYADNLYAGEIAYTDHCIGTVIDKLKELDLYDSTLIIIVGDHGEGLGDHGELTHEYFTYQSTMHIPLIIKGPGIAPGSVYQDVVSLVDITPTILGSLKQSVPDNMQGVDLSYYFAANSQPETPRAVYHESLIPTKFGCNPLLGLVSDNWSYIQANTPELYNLENDPEELNNLAQQQSQRVQLMSGQLQDMISQWSVSESTQNQISIDEATRTNLESIGYVGRAVASEKLTIDANLKDPTEMILCHELEVQATHFFNANKFEQARAKYLEIVARWPQLPMAYPKLMGLGFATNNYEDVIKYGQAYFNLHPAAEWENTTKEVSFLQDDLAANYLIMIQATTQLQRSDLAVEYCEKYLQLKPDDPSSAKVKNSLALAYFRLGQHQAAFDLWSQVVREQPDMVGVYENLGTAYYQLGDLDQAILYFNQILQLDPQRSDVRNNLQMIEKLKELEQSAIQY